MAAVSQTLVDFVRRLQPVAEAGQTWDVTPERMLRFQPSFPIAGPNLCGEVRTTAARLPALVEEVRAIFAGRGLPCMWLLDEQTRPSDLGKRLQGLGFALDAETHCLLLPAGSPSIEADPHIEICDGLESFDAFGRAARLQARAFGDPEPSHGLEQRYEESRSKPAHRLLVAYLEGQPAGAGWAEVTERGTMLRGGAVAPEFRGRGVYRALVSARQCLAEAEGSGGLATHARADTSAPILLAFGFHKVGTRFFFLDTQPAPAGARRR
jgi:GNAT superfamily N-acetyltransferase